MALSRKAWFEEYVETGKHEVQLRYVEPVLPVAYMRSHGRFHHNPEQYTSYKKRLATDVAEFLSLGLVRKPGNRWPKKWAHRLFLEVSYPDAKSFANAPDASNLLKSVEDALSGVLWYDDKPLYLIDSRCRVWDMSHCGYVGTHITVRAVSRERHKGRLELKRPDQSLGRSRLLS